MAEKTGFAPQYIEEQGEYAPGKTGLSYVFAPPGGQDTMNGLNAADYLWIMQRQAVLELAEKGSCVIVGPVSYTHLDVYKRQGYRRRKLPAASTCC